MTTRKSVPKTDASSENFQVLSLEIENVLRIKLLKIEPPTNEVVLVAGPNDSGKSSALLCIWMAMGGKKIVPADVLRHGQDTGHLELTVGDPVTRKPLFISRWEFQRDEDDPAKIRERLILKWPSGKKIGEPHTFLNAFYGRFSFRPMLFDGLRPEQRVESLFALVPEIGMQYAKFKTDYDEQYERRTGINTNITNLQGELAALPTPADDCPTEVLDTEKLLDERKSLEEINKQHEEDHRTLGVATTVLANLTTDIRELEHLLAKKKAEKKQATTAAREWQKKVDGNEPVDFSVIDEQLSSATGHNERVTERDKWVAASEKIKAAKSESSAITKALKHIKTLQVKLLANADLPVKGLGISDDQKEVTLAVGGVPVRWPNLGTALRTNVSTCLGMAGNPKLRVILIDEGSVIDERSMEKIRELARKWDYQIWVASAHAQFEPLIILEDGAAAK